MAAHKRFTLATDIQVYFCGPQNPWSVELMQKDGSTRWFTAQFKFLDSNNTDQGAVLTLHDVTAAERPNRPWSVWLASTA